MSIFRSILSKIFGAENSGEKSQPETQQSQFSPTSAGTQATATQQGATPLNARPTAPVDVEAVLQNLAAQNPQKLNWRTSIVDLMKLLDLDSSLTARKELAHELGYSGDMADSAAMNMWLHKQVMQKLAQNGGKVPRELTD